MRCNASILKTTIAIAFLILSSLAIAQKKEYNYFTKVEIPARFGYRPEVWFNNVERNFNFSSLPKNGEVENLWIALKLMIDIKGKITSIYYLLGDYILLNPVCDMLNKSGKWSPAMNSGRDLPSYRDLTVSFRFNKESNKWEFVRSVEDYNMARPEIFTNTEIIARYINYNQKKWFEFVESEFDFSSLPKEGNQDSLVAEARFAVLVDGSIIQITFINNSSQQLIDPVYQLLLKTYGRWQPAIQGSREVNSYRRLRLSFKFDKEKNKWEFVRNIKDYMIFPYDL